jgi:hypothetical protein
MKLFKVPLKYWVFHATIKTLAPLKGALSRVPFKGISPFTKFILILFSTPLRGEKQEMNFQGTKKFFYR